MAFNLGKEKIEKIRDFLTWTAIASLAVWVFAKGFGWINSPVIVEQYPVLVAMFVAGAFFQEFREFKKEMKEFKREMGEFKVETRRDLNEVKGELRSIDKRLVTVELSG